MIHPDTKVSFISETMGYGVVATRFIPRGTITWVQDRLDREFTPQEVAELDHEQQRILDVYSFRNNRGNHVLCWDNGKYINHSFKSNCFTTAYDFEIAIRDIIPGEQLTDDYGYLNVTEPFKCIDEGTRRKVVYPDDLLRYYPAWDRKVAKSFRLIPGQAQPLQRFLPAGMWETIVRIAQGQQNMESLLNCYCMDPFPRCG